MKVLNDFVVSNGVIILLINAKMPTIIWDKQLFAH